MNVTMLLEMVEAEEPTEEVKNEIAKDNFEVVGELATISVDEQLKDLDVNDIKLYGVGDDAFKTGAVKLEASFIDLSIRCRHLFLLHWEEQHLLYSLQNLL